MTEEIIQWGKLTSDERNMLVHTRVMGLHPEICDDGQLDPYMGAYWGCTCGWVSRFHLGSDESTEHNKPTPRYSESMDAAWKIMELASDNKMPAYPDMTSYWTYKAFLYALWRDENITEWIDVDLYNPCALQLEFDQIVVLSPRRICIAALRAVGCIVEDA